MTSRQIGQYTNQYVALAEKARKHARFFAPCYFIFGTLMMTGGYFAPYEFSIPLPLMIVWLFVLSAFFWFVIESTSKAYVKWIYSERSPNEHNEEPGLLVRSAAFSEKLKYSFLIVAGIWAYICIVSSSIFLVFFCGCVQDSSAIKGESVYVDLPYRTQQLGAISFGPGWD